MVRRTGQLGIAIALMVAISGVARAQAPAPSTPGVVYKKKTIFSFEDDTIDGDLTKPDGAYVESRKRVRHSNLIRIRDNFRDKILQSVSKI